MDKQVMPCNVQSDCTQAMLGSRLPKGVRVMQVGSFRMENVVSLDEFKSRCMDLRSLKPAVLMGQTLIVASPKQQQWR